MRGVNLNMNLGDLRSLDFKNISGWPLVAKLLGVAAVCAVILVAGYTLFIQERVAQLEETHLKEETLKQTFRDKKAQALNLAALKEQLAVMERTFGELLRQLPNNTEVPNLLVDITLAGQGKGLEFVYFKPEKERPVDFYAELPITLRVTGTYHELGQFISEVAALPRIVTFGDVQIQSDGKSAKLMISAMAKTYRYLEEHEVDAIQAAKQKTEGRK